MNFSRATEEFYRRCLGLNLSHETIRKYEKVLGRLEKTLVTEKLGANGSEININDITANLIRYHFSLLRDRMQPITMRIHYMCLHSFFTFLKNEELIAINIMKKVEKPKVPKKEIPAFTKEEVNLLLSVFDKSTFVGYRNYTITCVLFGSGMRRGEISRLLIDDIHFDINIIKVMGKGNKVRNVPLGDSLRRVLLRYLKIRKEFITERGFNNSPYLFISSNTGNKFNVESFTELFNTIGRNEGLKGVRVSPHTFRHTFAKFFLLNGGDVFSLQKILGHADITTTKKYINLNDNDIRIQNDRYNPLENGGWRFF
ncbi:tyrosine-type recombinase/integrase [uncultured Phascolarctobacterium sp.]|uniref:tyrosine-type recombinase/integrase n=1 Tax=uncultured Phascolarctobacterium sp. TaxID=512296 RepID=UPI0026271E61|nr:tyrosine-type recombinase/integrase [uncultured Phascolarctobacterium sp.]